MGIFAKHGPTPIERVAIGMPVVDKDGEQIGPVEYLQMGDGAALTTRGSETPMGTAQALVAAFNDHLCEPQVPGPLRDRLLRSGYIKVDRPGPEPFDTDLYAGAGAIESVVDGVVYLSLRKAELIAESSDFEIAATGAAPTGPFLLLTGPM
jgi:hypothetical protein